MVTVNLAHAKAHLSELLKQVEAGQEVTITPAWPSSGAAFPGVAPETSAAG